MSDALEVLHLTVAVLERDPLELGAQAIVRCATCAKASTLHAVGRPPALELLGLCTSCAAELRVRPDWAAELEARFR